jgi:hypothetical protein
MINKWDPVGRRIMREQRRGFCPTLSPPGEPPRRNGNRDLDSMLRNTVLVREEDLVIDRVESVEMTTSGQGPMFLVSLGFTPAAIERMQRKLQDLVAEEIFNPSRGLWLRCLGEPALNSRPSKL